MRTRPNPDRPLRRNVLVADRSRARSRCAEGSAGAHRRGARRHPGRRPRALLSQHGGPRDRPGRRTRRRPPSDRARNATRSSVRVRAASRHPGLSAGGHRAARRRRRRRRGIHEQRGVPLHRHALGWVPRRGQGARRLESRQDHRGRTGLPGAGRHARNRREPSSSVRHLARGPRRAGRPLAPPRGRRATGRAAGRSAHPGHRDEQDRRPGDRHRRASPRRYLGGGLEQAQTRAPQAGSAGDGDRGELERPERRGVHVPGHHRPEGGRTGVEAAGSAGFLGCCGCAAKCHGHWARARHGVGAAKRRAHAPRHGSDRAQRGLRRASAGRDGRMEVRRIRAGAHQRAGFGHLARAPRGRHGRTLATLARELDRRAGRYGLETMCIGGGQGLAAVFERVATS